MQVLIYYNVDCVCWLQVAEMTFNYWYKLSEDLYHKNSAELNEIFKPFIQRLIVALCQHCQMDSDHVGACILLYDLSSFFQTETFNVNSELELLLSVSPLLNFVQELLK